ncbi:hypothetical protein [Lacipirellula parvula]|uniref:Uncharacterized protein n=1 Tax=Lacipirellula parvula TaxID=2650471 RepID=A0A5K7XEJ1_9BACT|nr:hypothetical protein [Lacipirellula parvula]BBO34477.1 hypothetical protein PLANPX_4089 [Lacipirellula parvula]
MSEEETTTLDYIDNIVVPGNVYHEPANEYWTLTALWQGMEYLYRQVLRCEQTALPQFNKVNFGGEEAEVNAVFIGGGNLIPGLPYGLLSCSFDWYAVSACKFAWTVGAIAYEQDETRPLPQKYTEAIIPEVVTFRNKVGAHAAWSTRNKKDNDAERLASVIPQIQVLNNRLCVQLFNVHLRRDGVSSDSTKLQEWSLTEVHEQLTRRYCPPRDETTPSASDTDKPASEPPADQGQQP